MNTAQVCPPQRNGDVMLTVNLLCTEMGVTQDQPSDPCGPAVTSDRFPLSRTKVEQTAATTPSRPRPQTPPNTRDECSSPRPSAPSARLYPLSKPSPPYSRAAQTAPRKVRA
jgi:hypothetical protein